MSAAELRSLFASLHFYYRMPDALQAPASLLDGGRRGAAAGGEGWQALPLGSNHSCFKPPGGHGIARQRFSGWLPCPGKASDGLGGAGSCLEGQAAFARPWTRELEAATFIEVQHAAFGNKDDPNRLPHAPIGWAEFMDSGPAGMWYHVVKGSGVFYRTGTSLTAPSKNLAVARLLEEAGARRSMGASWWPPKVFSSSWLCAQGRCARGASSLASGLRATANGSATCREAGVARCRADFILDDAWDNAMAWLARSLGYDTIVLTASLCCLSDPTTACGVTELVDMRLPSPPSLTEQLNRSLLRLVKPTDKKTPRLARAWIQSIQDSGVLSLRDPMHVDDDARSRPCHFRATRWLGCEDHPSGQLAKMLIGK